MSELKKCPFCGGKNIYMGAFDFSPDCNIECEDCGAGFCTEVPWERNKGSREEEIKAHDKLCKDILMELWNTRADGWISVKDELPEKNEQVMIYVKTYFGHEIDIARLEGKKKDIFRTLDVSYELEEVTHWQPLPEPPKGD